MKRKAGFTLIEIVMVLAIAGLMIVLLFLALAQAQRGKRDNDREEAAGKVLQGSKAWVANNDGILPANQTDADLILSSIAGSGFSGPNGSWSLTYGAVPVGATPGPNIYIMAPASCTGGNIAAATGGRQVSVAVVLESGNNYCVSN